MVRLGRSSGGRRNGRGANITIRREYLKDTTERPPVTNGIAENVGGFFRGGRSQESGVRSPERNAVE